MIMILVLAACFLAYANGANDNFKGVASLYGSRTTTYRTALVWATVTTFAGSVAAMFLAQSLLAKFSGKGIVPDVLAASNYYLFAVAIGAGATVLIASLAGFPISTTHAITGAILGAGFVAAGSAVNLRSLAGGFFVPLLLSPLLAVLVAAALYCVLHFARLRMGISKQWCVCVGTEVIPVPQFASSTALATAAAVQVAAGERADCAQRYVGSYLGISAQTLMDAGHFLSAGVVSFARGLNDTPKIAAMLLVVRGLNIEWGIVAIAVAIAAGGWLGARRVAETMSVKITQMNHGQGFAANIATGLLVILASKYGLPVSTTHVSVGALFGIGLITREANPSVVLGILLSWLLTLPCAAAAAALAFFLAAPR
jgi:PiT family inorganic phosphate transporter